ncbi:hypothetical protein IQ247_23990 [Plectonema cf. radiosum LEGE 06105]|uniref:Uncharacterized protein n=1 Tax=Plectonema cf. radiosum LEGE 06105 TaxID=945769 RepID=A0A8J7FC54_9CYAN|nr:hypothetical protein [Plectonema radiosum]MBE9215689.1 hypothetical protein [Plectonema cf. radiosum LEGE 06105]
MANKGKPLGPRVTVLFGDVKRTGRGKQATTKGSARYVYMLKSTAEFFGFKVVPNAQVVTKNKATLAVRGSSGAGSIKLYVKSGDKNKAVRIPVPGGATITEIKAFLQKATKVPESFTSVNGRQYPIGAKKGAKP